MIKLRRSGDSGWDMRSEYRKNRHPYTVLKGKPGVQEKWGKPHKL